MSSACGKHNKILGQIEYWAVLNAGTLLLAAGVYFFKNPHNFATGGVSGIAIILSNFITPYVKFLGKTEIMAAINVLLIIIGFIFLGRGCTLKTVYCSLVYSLEMWLMQFIPVDLPLTNEKFLEFVYAMLLTGAGSAIIFNCKASSGGTDIVALIIKKYTPLDIGKALFASDFIIASSTFFIFGVETGMFSLLGLFVKAFLVDEVIESIGKCKRLTIITEKPELVAPFILETMRRDFTYIDAKGGFTGKKKAVMLTVLKRLEALRLKAQILKADPAAFVIITDANEIIGKGFRGSFQ